MQSGTHLTIRTLAKNARVFYKNSFFVSKRKYVYICISFLIHYQPYVILPDTYSSYLGLVASLSGCHTITYNPRGSVPLRDHPRHLIFYLWHPCVLYLYSYALREPGIHFL